MLSRYSSNASLGARRSRSTSPFRHSGSSEEYAGFENEEIAHARAVTAAERAFELAKARRRAIRRADDAEKTSTHDQTQKPALIRQKSIRFAGPTAVPLRSRSITRSHVAVPHPTSEDQDSFGRLESAREKAENSKVEQLVTGLPDGEELFLEHAFGSQPSSYRRLSKSKSLFALDRKKPSGCSTAIPKAGQHFRRHSVRSSGSSQEATRTKPLPLRRTRSLLRPWTSCQPDLNRQYATNDKAVRLARDQFAHDVQQQRLKQQPSFWILRKGHRSHKAFPRSVRTGSTDSYGDVMSSSSTAADTLSPGSPGSKARSYSQSLRNRLKRVFLRKSSGGEEDLPAQHLDATRQHFGKGTGLQAREDRPYPGIPSPDAELLQRVNSRESFNDHDSIPSKQNQGFGSIRSVQNLDSAHVDSSRVTSWTDSTAANTIHIPRFSDRKRLSVIKENGNPYQPSTNGVPSTKPDYDYAAFRQPYRQSSSSEPLEPQRIFSALQKEIVKKKSRPTIGDSESEMDDDSDHLGPGSSNETLQRSRSTPQQTVKAQEEKADRAKRPLHEHGSGFFHANQHIEQKQSPSPFRRALCVSMEDVAPIGAGRSQQNVKYPNRGTPTESFYSRSPGGYTHGHQGGSLSWMDTDNAEDAGTALILPAESRGYRCHQHRLREGCNLSEMSSNPSGEWKRRLASEMMFSDDGNPHIEDDVYNALPVRDGRFGHRKEHAQLDGTETGNGKVIPEDCGRAQPLVLGSDLKSRPTMPSLQTHHLGPDRCSDENHDPSSFSEAYGPSEHVRAEIVPAHAEASILPPGRDSSGTLRNISNSFLQKASSVSPIGLDKGAASSSGFRRGSRLDLGERVQGLRSESSMSLQGSRSATNLASKAGFLTENRTVSNVQAQENMAPLKRRTSKENSTSPNSPPTYGPGNRLLVENFCGTVEER